MINSSQEMVRVAVEAARNKKAKDIVALDIRDVSVFADYFVICSGNSTTQVKAIADEIEEKMDQAGYLLDHVEGYREERWILLDYKDVVIHVFHAHERDFYNLERLWRDARILACD